MKRRHNFLDVYRRVDGFDGGFDNEQQSCFLDKFSRKWFCKLILNSQNFPRKPFEFTDIQDDLNFTREFSGRTCQWCQNEISREFKHLWFFMSNFLKVEYPIFSKGSASDTGDLLQIAASAKISWINLECFSTRSEFASKISFLFRKKFFLIAAHLV